MTKKVTLYFDLKLALLFLNNITVSYLFTFLQIVMFNMEIGEAPADGEGEEGDQTKASLGI